VHRQVALTIFNGGIRLISSNVIGLAIYLGSWALITFVIAFRFLLDSRPFFVKGNRCK